jgi:hypothetical protein
LAQGSFVMAKHAAAAAHHLISSKALDEIQQEPEMRERSPYSPLVPPPAFSGKPGSPLEAIRSFHGLPEEYCRFSGQMTLLPYCVIHESRQQFTP